MVKSVVHYIVHYAESRGGGFNPDGWHLWKVLFTISTGSPSHVREIGRHIDAISSGLHEGP